MVSLPCCFCGFVLVSEDDRSAQEEITEAMGNDHHVNFDHERSDSWVDEEVEKATSAECKPSEGEAAGQGHELNLINLKSCCRTVGLFTLLSGLSSPPLCSFLFQLG